MRQFLAAIRDHRLHAPVLPVPIGMRPTEICGLKWSAVELDAETLSIELTRTPVEGEVEGKGPKSGKGKRKLPLPTPLHAALEAFKARQAGEAMKAGKPYERSGFALIDERGQPWQTDRLRRAIHSSRSV
ncbi:hypothetical protein ACQPYE_10195 [Actinosynnema sp. CA-299493]